MTLTIGQLDFLIQNIRKQEGLEMFDLSDSKMMFEQLEDMSNDQRSRFYRLINSNRKEDLIDMLDQFGVKRINNNK